MQNETGITRRMFTKQTAGLTAATLAAAGSAIDALGASDKSQSESNSRKDTKHDGSPIIISTWNFGIEANRVGWEVLADNGTAVDAVEKAARATELNPNTTSVGYGGFPNEHGVVQLDAAIIDGKSGKMGAVGALEGIRSPISVARKVMEQGPHIFVVGDGAREFAQKNGFREQNMLTEKSAGWYAKQMGKQAEEPDDHDTIGVLSLDAHGDMAVACTTSGLAMKWNGRVGDSPLIGAGLYLDGDVGGAVGTGVGERAIEVCGAFAITEFMRDGLSPQAACEKLIKRVVDRNRDRPAFQLAFIALNKQGEIGAASVQEGFSYAECVGGENVLKPGRAFGTDFE